MITRLIDMCVHNRALVILLTIVLLAAGWFATQRITVDALPDLSDVQVVLRTDFAGQAPDIVENQVTYPLTTAMLAVPGAETVRGYSMFGTSFVYILFEEGTDLYWARSRVLEQLSTLQGRLPVGVAPQLGPDATGVGWVYQYVLLTGPWCAEHPGGLWEDTDNDQWYVEPPPEALEAGTLVHHRIFPERDTCPLSGKPLEQPTTDLGQLRSLQDWFLRYELTALPGVSEVAAVGGFTRQYQITLDPVKLQGYGLTLAQVKMAVQRSNRDVGGRSIEQAETEYIVRSRGYLGSPGSPRSSNVGVLEDVDAPKDRSAAVLSDLRQIGLGATPEGAPIYLADVATVQVGPDQRRGIAEWNGKGETVAGTIVMRFGENARAVITRVQEKLDELEAGLPPGVAIATAYDRSDLIDRAIETVRHTLVEEIIVVSLVMLLFLLHARSALVAACVLPLGVLATVLLMWLLGLNANIMSLGGIAISIGVMVDSSIVMVENAHKHLERFKHEHGREPRGAERVSLIAEASKEVGPTLFFSLLIITVSFLPIFALGEQSGRLFKPLAFSKTFAMSAGAVLAVTVIPVLMVYFLRERTLPGNVSRSQNPRSLNVGFRWVYVVGIALPMVVLAFVPLGEWAEQRGWLVALAGILAAVLLLPQRILPEEKNPLSRLMQRAYEPAFRLVMRFRLLTVLVGVAALLSTLYPWSQLGREFMPPLAEGDLLYMPTTDPGLSVTKARELLQLTDRLIAQFPEVQSTFGKIGRADTATDPAPLTMIETTISLHRDESKWRHVPVQRFYHGWPKWLAWLPSRLLDSTRPITTDQLIYGYTIPAAVNSTGEDVHVPGLDTALKLPGVSNAWTMPIKTRLDMLSTGIRTPVGVKIMGEDLETLARLAEEVRLALQTDPDVAPYTASAFADQAVGGRYLDIVPDRQAIARFPGLTVMDVQEVIASAVGGINIDQTVEGLERYPINLRYPRELRDNLPALEQLLVQVPDADGKQRGQGVPLNQLASLRITTGPPMIKSENARRTAWVFVDIQNRDIGRYVDAAKLAVAEQVQLPPGYSIVWSGQYQYMQEARARLTLIIPLAGVAILLLLFAATRSWLRVAIVLLAVPFSMIGALWFVWLLDYEMSLAVWVGIIALAGLDAETGLVMLLYLDQSYEKFKKEGRLRDVGDLMAAIHDGAVQRIRPKTMTVVTTFAGLLPLLWADGAGADTMRRLAAPMIGGLTTSFLLELLLYPVIFYYAKRVTLRRAAAGTAE